MRLHLIAGILVVVLFGFVVIPLSGQGTSVGYRRDGQHLFERETFGGNGRTCLTCHSRATGTVSPADAQARFLANPLDPLFLHDGSDDGIGNGVARMLTDATVLIPISMHPNVRLADSDDRTVVLRRGIPTTLNTPALEQADHSFMLDGRQPTLEAQALGAIRDHAQVTAPIAESDLRRIAQFQQTDAFFSSRQLRDFARYGAPAPQLPAGTTASERRGRRFFEDVPPNPPDFTPGLCSHCHSGPLLNQTNEFAPLFVGIPIPVGTRFANVFVSFFNKANNPVREFVFNANTPDEVRIVSADPGRALVTGELDPLFHVEAFKISQLRGIRHTAPYFHDNSARTLEEVAAHYTRFFSFVTGGFISLTPQDEADMVAFMKLLD